METGTRRLASAGAGRIFDDPRRRGGGKIARSVRRHNNIIYCFVFRIIGA